ncbi:MAG TPA: gamma-glutamyl-gamma-aminobutyrate hydrolase family protein [Pseudogracilibacillus sp.]|nr:gamma-glutamyl-gamma-aminobutyrate hydrolase family protein [Pseudogracilibacillus sp.]
MKKPIIGVTPSIQSDEKNYFINRDNAKVIEEMGGIPYILPHSQCEDNILQIAEMIDGLYLTGGNDIDPTFFGEEPHPKLGTINPTRDFFEDELIQQILQLNKPLLGVCRGAQILNISLGGTMYQDIYAQMNRDLIQHSQNAPVAHGSHFVKVTPDSLLHRIVETDSLRVNSRHHQANKTAGKGLIFSGMANDGVIEAVESTEHHFVLGLQWHPENLAMAGCEQSKKIFTAFIEACKK